MNCNEVLDKLADYLDEEAREELCRQIEEHLRHCHDCQIEVDTVHKTIMLYQSDRSVEMPMKASTRLQAALTREYSKGG